MKQGLKRIISFMTVLLMLSTVITPTFAAELEQAGNPQALSHRGENAAYTLYVAPNGDDISGNGTSGSPFKTIERARDAVRLLDKSAGDIVVEIADGFYPASKTIQFDDRDSGSENCTIYYQAAQGAKPVISGGKILQGAWTEATDVTWLAGGRTAYKTTLNRNDKLRAIYVNGQRAAMTKKTASASTTGCTTGSVTAGAADYVWNNRSGFYTQNRFANTVFPVGTRNQRNIELETQTTWNRAIVCVDNLVQSGDYTFANFQMPYGGLAQTIGWADYKPSGSQTIYNVFEWLANPGEFYFDQAASTLYYIPRDGENINTAQVVIPEIERILDVRGSYTFDGDTESKQKTGTNYVHHITFEGLTFAYTDWNLYKIENSNGYATVQGCIVAERFGNSDWHKDMYRSYDVPPAAVTVNTAHDIRVLDGEIIMTGCLGIHLENDVYDCEVTGNNISFTGGGGIIIGHPQHVYENDDAAIHKVPGGTTSNPTAAVDKEKFRYGTEAVPRDILITNNYLDSNCYFFPGHSPLASFYTRRLQVLHNFIYRCPYGGMSIGWGWCNFDGSPASITDSNTLPGVPTTTSKENTVSYNRVEEIGTILHDTGGIYTLGQQGDPGNDPAAPGGIYSPLNWTNVTHMDYNYINVSRTPQVADGSRMLNGFHPDEGSKFIKFNGNVITNIIRNVYEMNNWKRKQYMQVTGGFSNTSRSETTAPNCTLEQYVDPTYTWPPTGHDIVLNSGLEDQYAHLVEKSIIPDTDYELASNVRVGGGYGLNKRGLLSENDEVWLVPKDTVVGDGSGLSESNTMTMSPGNAKTITAPAEGGEYKLYIKYENGAISAPSTFTMFVGEKVANVANGGSYKVSYAEPLKLELNTQNYDYTLNDKPVNDGYVITEENTWVLKATPKIEGFTEAVINFTTTVADADKLLPYTLLGVKPGGTIRFAANLQDSAKEIWIAPYATAADALNENNAKMTKTTGDSSIIVLPKDLSADGGYHLYVVEGCEITSVSGATIRASVSSDLPVRTGLDMWLKAEEGVTTVSESDNGVTGWKNQASGDMADKTMVPADSARRPKLMEDAEKGYKYVYFDTEARQLQVTGFKNYSGRSGVTIFAVNYPESNYDTVGWGNSDQSSAVYFNEEPANWGGISLCSATNAVAARFGAGDNNVNTRLIEPVIGLTTAMIMKDGTTNYIYINGEKRVTDTGKPATLVNIGTTVSLGRALAGTPQPAFTGRIAEVVIYDRSLTETEISSVNRYLEEKYFGGGGQTDDDTEKLASEITSLPDVAPGETRLTFPTLPEGYSVEVKESTPAGIIDAYGKVTVPNKLTEVELTLTVYKLIDNTSADTAKIKIKVYPDMSAQDIADTITLSDVLSNDMWLTLPDLPFGFTVKIESADPAIIDANGNVAKPAAVTDVSVVLTVTKTADKTTGKTMPIKIKVYPYAPLPNIPQNGLDVWLMADRGVSVENGEVTGWKNQAGGALSYATLTPSNNTMRPKWRNGGLDGYSYIHFDENSKQLKIDEIKNYNGLTGMTMIAVNLPEAVYTGISTNNSDKRSVVYFSESGSYGGANIGVGTNGIATRFGDGSSSPAYTRYIAPINELTSMMSIKNGINYSVYVNGESVATAQGGSSRVTTANIGQTLMVGGCLYMEDLPYRGRVAEVLVYDRALTADEIAQIQTYIDSKYFGGEIPDPVDKSLLEALVQSAGSLDEADYTSGSWTALQSVLTQAKAVVAKIDATQDEVDAAYAELQTAINSLVSVTPVLTFADGKGNTIDSLSADMLVTSLKYYNRSDKSEKLTLYVAVYTPDGKLIHLGMDTKEIGALQLADFKVSLDMPENSDSIYETAGYTANVFLWDSNTFVPVMDKYKFQ